MVVGLQRGAKWVLGLCLGGSAGFATGWYLEPLGPFYVAAVAAAIALFICYSSWHMWTATDADDATNGDQEGIDAMPLVFVCAAAAAAEPHNGVASQIGAPHGRTKIITTATSPSAVLAAVPSPSEAAGVHAEEAVSKDVP